MPTTSSRRDVTHKERAIPHMLCVDPLNILLVASLFCFILPWPALVFLFHSVPHVRMSRSTLRGCDFEPTPFY